MMLKLDQAVVVKANLYENLILKHFPSEKALNAYRITAEDIVRAGTIGVIAAILPTTPVTYGVQIGSAIYHLPEETLEIIPLKPITEESIKALFE